MKFVDKDATDAVYAIHWHDAFGKYRPETICGLIGGHVSVDGDGLTFDGKDPAPGLGAKGPTNVDDRLPLAWKQGPQRQYDRMYNDGVHVPDPVHKSDCLEVAWSTGALCQHRGTLYATTPVSAG